jgi:hypothetical protein
MEKDIQHALYKRLKYRKREIRLLELMVDVPEGEAVVSCNMAVASLDDQPIYLALSLYAWDDMSTTQTILVNGIQKRVASSLGTVLTRFRQMRNLPDPTSEARFWVDAVCIDQDSIAERSYHASHMGDLFSSAGFVLSWLGTAECVPTAIEALEVICEQGLNFTRPPREEAFTESARRKPFVGFRALERALDEPPHVYRGVLNTHRRWQAVHEFLNMPSWSDVWTLHDVILARPDGGLLFIGPGGILFDEHQLKGALDHLVYLSTGIAVPTRPEFVSENWWTRLQQLRRIKNPALELGSLLSMKKRLREETGYRRSWYTLNFFFTRLLQATDPRDYYYALSGVSKLHLTADYGPGKEAHEVCLDFMRVYLDANAHFHFAPPFLHYAIGLEDKERHKLPSWAPRTDFCSPMNFQLKLFEPSVEAFACIGLFDFLSQDDRARPTLSPDNRTLRVFGMRITTITFADHRPYRDFYNSGAMGVYLLEFTKRHTTTYVTGIPAAKALLAVMETKVNGSYDGFKACGIMHILLYGNLEESAQCVESTTIWYELLSFVRDDSEESARMLNISSYDVSEQNAREFADNLAANERLRPYRIIETRDGYLGLAPEEVAAGDLVCILDFFQYPVILRETADGFLFVGACFVLGLMNGEASKKWGGGVVTPEVFALS